MWTTCGPCLLAVCTVVTTNEMPVVYVSSRRELVMLQAGFEARGPIDLAPHFANGQNARVIQNGPQRWFRGPSSLRADRLSAE